MQHIINMKNTLILIVFLMCAKVQAQNIGIGTAVPNVNAVLEVKSSSKGILIPRMDSVARKNIPNTKGLMVYDTTSNSFWFNNGTQWSQVGAHHYIGEKFGGGIVFSVDANGEHGLIASTADQSTSAKWYASTYLWTLALGDGPGAGKSNSVIIIASQGYGDGSVYAARVTHEFTTSQNNYTYADWYLPSLSELNLMYQSKVIIGGFSSANYWSSTETDNNLSYSIDFSNGTQNLYLKNFAFNVRAIRSF